MAYEIKQLGIGGILDQAIKLVRDHFKLLFGIMAVLTIPFSLLLGVGLAIVAPQFFRPGEQGMEANALIIIAFIVGYLITFLVVIPLSNAAIIHAVASVYLDKPTSIGQAYRRALRVYFPYLGTAILFYIVVNLGLILFLVGAIIFFFWYCLATQIVVIEGTSGPSALKRSHQLMKGNYLQAFVLLLMYMIVSYGTNLSLGLLPSPVLQMIISAIWQAVLGVLVSAAVIVFYFSCRCKHENFDLAMLAEGVADEDAPQLGAT